MSALNDKFIGYLKLTDEIKYKIIIQFAGGAATGNDVLLPDGFIRSFSLERNLRDELPLGLQEADIATLEFNIDSLIDNDNYSFTTIRDYILNGVSSFTPTTITMEGTTSIDLVIPNHITILSNEANPGVETYETRIFAGVQEITAEQGFDSLPFYQAEFISDVKFALENLKPNYEQLNYDVDLTNLVKLSASPKRTIYVLDSEYIDSRDTFNKSAISYYLPYFFQFCSLQELVDLIELQARHIIREVRKDASQDFDVFSPFEPIQFYPHGTSQVLGKSTPFGSSSVHFIAVAMRPAQTTWTATTDYAVRFGFLDPNDDNGFEKRYSTCWDLLNGLSYNGFSKGVINYDYANGDNIRFNRIYAKYTKSASAYSALTVNDIDIDAGSVEIKRNKYNYQKSKSITPNMVSGDEFTKESLQQVAHEYIYESGVQSLNKDEPENDLIFHNNYIYGMNANDTGGLLCTMSSHINTNALYEFGNFSNFRFSISTLSNFAAIKINDQCDILTDVNGTKIETEDVSNPAVYDPIPQRAGQDKYVGEYNEWLDGRLTKSGLPYLIAKADVETFSKNKISYINFNCKNYKVKPDDLGRLVEFDDLNSLSGGRDYLNDMLTNEFIISSIKLDVAEGSHDVTVELFGTGR